MTIKQMEYILELSRTRNFNRAAENLFITQPALTYQIQRAEEEIGFTLFIRSGKGAALTIAGESFVTVIEHILEEYSEAVKTGQSLDPLFSAAITIALPSRFAIPKLAETIQAFEEQYPKTPVTPRYYYVGEPIDMPDADIAFVVKGSYGFRRKGWRERFVVPGYSGKERVPKVIDVQEEGEDLIWVPFASTPVETMVMTKNEQARGEVLTFLEMFKAAAIQ